jgi:hypothetical protein
MLDQKTIDEINRGYVCPPDAGPAWRAAHEAGNDMSLLESTLSQTPEQRLVEHQQLINFLISINPSILNI